MKGMRFLFIISLLSLSITTYSQHDKNRVTQFADITAGVASYRGSFSVAYVRDWKPGKNRKFEIGFGGRFTSFIGANRYYITAPAKLTSESTSPLILFKENIIENIDSLLVKSPQVNAFNLCITIDYVISQKFTTGFNIDIIGFSFGDRQRGNYMNGVQRKNTAGEPTPFNILLISDNDKGTLNSELYVKYFLNKKWGIKLAAQFLFTEYTTKTKVQQLPEANDRFRNKSLLLGFGITYKLD